MVSVDAGVDVGETVLLTTRPPPSRLLLVKTLVTVTVTGDGQVQKIAITDEALRAGDKSTLEGFVLAAVQDGITKAERLRTERMSKVTGGLHLPGLM